MTPKKKIAGYSGTALVDKLGFKAGKRGMFIGAPKGFVESLRLPPPSIPPKSDQADYFHIFVRSSARLEGWLPRMKEVLADNGMIWVSWPKKASKVPTDLTEDVVRSLALPLGLVDIKVCAIDETWSGLKLVIRREERR